MMPNLPVDVERVSILDRFSFEECMGLQRRLESGDTTRHYVLHGKWVRSSLHSDVRSPDAVHLFFGVPLFCNKTWVIPRGHYEKVLNALQAPLEELPMLLIEETLPSPYCIVKWRLEIGK